MTLHDASSILRRACGLLLLMGLVMPATAGSPDGPAPDFRLPARAGEEVVLSGLRGQVVMINFWASWCGPCRKEMPFLDQLYQRYRGLGFVMLGVNVEQDSAAAEGWLKDTPVTFPILFDRRNEVSKRYDVTAMPSTVIVDRQGRLRYVHYGYTAGTENEYQDQIRALVRERS
jgi:peroxiredoxin